MLNISPNSTTSQIDTTSYASFGKSELPRAHWMFTRWMAAAVIIFLILLFLPWTQNIQAKGKVTTLTPDQRPQTIHATIAGRIEKWYVREGQLVKKGDTIVHLSEIKADYFDPDLVPRTASQVDAKQSAIVSYGQKVTALEQQIAATQGELKFKLQQLKNKVEQEKLKAVAAKADYEADKVQYEIAMKQYNRSQELFGKGLESRTGLENRQNKLQEAQAKMISSENKWRNAENEVGIASTQINTTQSEYANKIAKAESDKFSTLSDKYDAEASLSKLKIQLENYARRNAFYYITAPQDCYITKAVTQGVGETVKEGEPVVTILPAMFQLAVEMYVDPIDLPLIHPGNKVRFMFDGWPAFVFSGWPNQSFGTYAGRVFAIDNVISSNNKYRVLVAPDPAEVAWPNALRPGSGAKSIALLNDVPVWYEIWRQLNGFPPDYYGNIGGNDGAGDKEKK